jgi:hypothetical protein
MRFFATSFDPSFKTLCASLGTLWESRAADPALVDSVPLPGGDGVRSEGSAAT